jgi:hypothetical protein
MGNPAGGAAVSEMKFDHAEQKVVDDIRDYGCHIMHVFDDVGSDPDFSYTIGLPVTVDQPEVIFFSLEKNLRQYALNEVRRQCQAGLALSDGLRISNLIEGFDCIARRITSQQAIYNHFGWAIWYHRTQRNKPVTEAYQIVWPGAVQRLFPWEEGCDYDVIELQPPLYEAVAA